MVTKCPKCAVDIEHEDFLFEVLCKNCKARFNPFMQAGTDANQHQDSGAQAGIEPSTLNAADQFQESNTALDELKQFGETIDLPGDKKEKAAAAPPAQPPTDDALPGGSPSMPSLDLAAFTVPGAQDDFPITSGDSLSGYKIGGYLAPVSVWGELDSSQPNPLAKAFQNLSAIGRQMGAGGMVGMRWALSADATRVLVTATPVRVLKE